MIFQISSTHIDQKCVPDPMGWITGPEICKEFEIFEEILLKNRFGDGFGSFGAHIRPFSAFFAGISTESCFGSNGIGLRGQSLGKKLKFA